VFKLLQEIQVIHLHVCMREESKKTMHGTCPFFKNPCLRTSMLREVGSVYVCGGVEPRGWPTGPEAISEGVLEEVTSPQ
jgi:hypothetical protein